MIGGSLSRACKLKLINIFARAPACDNAQSASVATKSHPPPLAAQGKNRVVTKMVGDEVAAVLVMIAQVAVPRGGRVWQLTFYGAL